MKSPPIVNSATTNSRVWWKRTSWGPHSSSSAAMMTIWQTGVLRYRLIRAPKWCIVYLFKLVDQILRQLRTAKPLSRRCWVSCLICKNHLRKIVPTCSVSTGLETRPTILTARLKVATTARHWTKSTSRKLRQTFSGSRRRNFPQRTTQFRRTRPQKLQVRWTLPRRALALIAQASIWHSPWCKSHRLRPSQDGRTSHVKPSTKIRYRLLTTSGILRTIRISLSSKLSKSYLRSSPA